MCYSSQQSHGDCLPSRSTRENETRSTGWVESESTPERLQDWASNPVILQGRFLDQQLWHRLGTRQKCRFSGPPQTCRITHSEWGPAIWLIRSPAGDPNACSSVRTTVGTTVLTPAFCFPCPSLSPRIEESRCSVS